MHICITQIHFTHSTNCRHVINRFTCLYWWVRICVCIREEVKKTSEKNGPKIHKCAKGASGKSMRGGVPLLLVGSAPPPKICKLLDANRDTWWHLASLILVGFWHSRILHVPKESSIQKGKLFLMFSQIQSTSNTSLIQMYVLKQLYEVETKFYNQQLGAFILHFSNPHTQYAMPARCTRQHGLTPWLQ